MRFTTLIPMLGLWLVLISQAFAEPSQKIQVSYDLETDRLSVDLEDASLTQVLGRIATLSGIEVLMDPNAERQVSYQFENLSMQRALKRLAGQTSHIFIYDNAATDESDETPTLIGMHILGKGEFSNDMLLPILAAQGEAFIREKNRYANHGASPEIFDHAQQRWEARLKRMDSSKREALLADARVKRERLEERNKQRELRKAENKARRDGRKLQRQQELEQLRIENPAAYDRKMQRREEILQQIQQK